MDQEQLQQVLAVLERKLANDSRASSVSESERAEYLEKLELLGMLKAIILAKSLQANPQASLASSATEGAATNSPAPLKLVAEPLASTSAQPTLVAPPLDTVRFNTQQPELPTRASHKASSDPAVRDADTPVNTPTAFTMQQESSTGRVVIPSAPSCKQHPMASTPQDSPSNRSSEARTVVLVEPPEVRFPFHPL